MLNSVLRCIGTASLLAAFLLVRPAHAKPTQRPILDFVAAQGTFCLDDGTGGCFLFVPPVRNFMGWGSNTNTNLASIDYAGLADRWISTAACKEPVSFETSFAGTIVEQPRGDGRALVTVELITSNALTFVARDDFATGELVFGVRAQDVCNGAEPILGTSRFHISFINTAPGARLPDLMQLFFAPGPGQELRNYAFTAEVHGAAASATVIQTGNAARSNVQAALVDVH